MQENGILSVWSRNAAVVMAALAFGVGMLAVPSSAQQPSEKTVLGRLSKGQWEIRTRDSSMPPRRTCLGDLRSLIQLRHADLPCNRVTTSQKADEITVQYMCRGRGFGRTHIRVENEALAQIDSQGIENGLPFAFTAEARRLGRCAG
jgi:hypothetical protein